MGKVLILQRFNPETKKFEFVQKFYRYMDACFAMKLEELNDKLKGEVNTYKIAHSNRG